MKIVTRPSLKSNYGIPWSNPQLLRLERAGKFPRRIRLSDNGRAGWLEAEILNWIERRAALRDSPSATPIAAPPEAPSGHRRRRHKESRAA